MTKSFLSTICNRATCFVAVFIVALSIVGCSRGYREDLDYDYQVVQTWPLEEIPHGEIVQFETVFWEPDDTVSMREQISEKSICSGRRVLEIGTGTGMISILCAENGANNVVATDINPAAVANAKYNAAMLAEGLDIEIRQVPLKSPGAFSIIGQKERFDLIFSNPPWEDGSIDKPADHAYYDPSFALMDSLLDGLPKFLYANGRCLLAYGHRPAIERLQVEAKKRNLDFKILDDRKLEDLERDFLPGMLIEIRVPSNSAPKSNAPNSTAPNDNPPTASGLDETPPI